MARIVLSDASPLIGLSLVEGLPWLQALFGEVWMPPEVEREVLTGRAKPGEGAIGAALSAGWLRVWTGAVPPLALPDLDEGEAACIRIAVGVKVSAGQPALLLIDEREGRAVAAQQQIAIAGTAAVIGLARQHGLMPSARASFERLHRSDIRISAEVIRAVLARVGES